MSIYACVRLYISIIILYSAPSPSICVLSWAALWTVCILSPLAEYKQRERICKIWPQIAHHFDYQNCCLLASYSRVDVLYQVLAWWWVLSWEDEGKSSLLDQIWYMKVAAGHLRRLTRSLRSLRGQKDTPRLVKTDGNGQGCSRTDRLPC